MLAFAFLKSAIHDSATRRHFRRNARIQCAANRCGWWQSQWLTSASSSRAASARLARGYLCLRLKHGVGTHDKAHKRRSSAGSASRQAEQVNCAPWSVLRCPRGFAGTGRLRPLRSCGAAARQRTMGAPGRAVCVARDSRGTERGCTGSEAQAERIHGFWTDSRGNRGTAARGAAAYAHRVCVAARR